MPSKLGYFSGPVDARNIYASLRSGDHTSLFGTSYMKHLMQVCEQQGRDAVILTTHVGASYEETLGRFAIVNRPPPGGSGMAYHWRQIGWTRDCVAELERYGARTVVMTASQHYWFITPPFRKRGMRFVNSYHCAVRPLGHRVVSPHEVLIRLTSMLHLSHGDPTMAVAPHILRQLTREPGAGKRRTWCFTPDYDRKIFADFKPHRIGEGPVEIIFAGRIEANKGVFDMVTACEALNRGTGRKYRFHFHGEGEALLQLRARVAASPCRDFLIVHGFTAGDALAAHYAASHIVVVPTRSDFDEGLAKSVIEGVLALRPVVTSRVCPAIEVVGEACVEARVDDPASYVAAFRQLAESPALMTAKAIAALGLRENFFAPEANYAHTLREALKVAEENLEPVTLGAG